MAIAKSKQPDKTSAKKADKPLKNKEKVADKKKPRKSKAKPPEEKKAPGRKEWEPDYTMIEKWASMLLNDKQIAAKCGIDHATFCRKKNQLNQLKLVLDSGRASTILACSQKLLTAAVEGNDIGALKFVLERQGGWKNVTVLETPSKDINDMTEEELLAIVNGQPI